MGFEKCGIRGENARSELFVYVIYGTIEVVHHVIKITHPVYVVVRFNYGMIATHPGSQHGVLAPLHVGSYGAPGTQCL